MQYFPNMASLEKGILRYLMRPVLIIVVVRMEFQA